VSVLKDFDFHGSTYAGWSHSRNSILTDAGVQMGAVIPGISDHGAWVALLSHPVAGDADIGGLSYLNSGVEIRFNAPNMTPPTDSLELLTLKCIHPSEDGFGISATYGTQKMYTRQKNGGSHIWANSDKAQLIGCHTLTLLRLDGGTIKTYLDGVAVDTWTGTPEPVGVLDHIGLGLNEFDGNQYWPIGAVVSRVTAFTVAAGASTAPFASWITGFYPTAGDPKAAPNADPDGDGLKNSVEYVLGTPPNAANPGGPSGSTSGSNFVFTFQRALASKHADTAVAIEVSTDLATWTAYDVNASPVVVTPGLDADHETVTLSLPRAPDAKKFARLQVSVSAAP